MPIPQLRERQSRNYGSLSSSPEPRGASPSPKKPRFPRWRIPRWSGFKRLPWKQIFRVGILVAAAGFVVGTGVVLWVGKDLPDPNKLRDRQVPQSTKIYDRTGEHLLYEVYQEEKRTLVEMDQISPWVPKAFIAIEDKNFYEHKGIRPISILRAAVNNFIGRRSGSGGASTMTQQLIKQTIVGDERRGLAGLFRKVKEAILAIRLERKYSKEEILKLYLNEIPLGSTNYGVEAAAQSYFRKKAQDLNAAEAATLAAMTQAPSRYLNNVEALRNRRDLVLRLMFEQGYITEEQKKEAQGSALRIYKNSGIFDAPHFVLYVRQLLADQFGERAVDTGGLRVITTLDYDKQKLAEAVMKEQSEKLLKAANANNAALVAVDPKTAQVLTLVGSLDFSNEEIDGQFNIVTLGKLQPGSSFKPFVYTAAFEKGYTPDTVLYDVKTDFDARGGKKYSPRNSYDKENGLVTMRKALQGSLNIPAVKTLYLVGVDDAINFARRFGYTTFNSSTDYGLSLILGSGEVNLLEHANAYATLANGGRYRSPVSILKVTDASGKTLYEWQASEGAEAVKPELSALITSVLTDDAARAYVFGRGGNLTLPDRAVAAKTGTTQDSKDAWTMGYTPGIAAGVWVGNTPRPLPMKAGGNQLAGAIWNQFMRGATKGTPVERFPDPPAKPEGLKPVLSGADGGIKLKINSVTGKIASSSTPEHLITEKIFLPPHDILHYIVREDPRGAAPMVPTDDPQYESWEAGLTDWIRRQQEKGETVTLEEPPTDYDSPQALELMPSVEIISPAAGSALTSRDMSIAVKAGAPRGVVRVVYLIDGFKIGDTTQFPFSFSYYAKMLAPGEHKLKAIAEDDIGTSGAAEVSFMLNVPLDPASVEWADSPPLIIAESEFPRAIYLSPFRWEAIKDIKVYLLSNESERLIYTFNHTEDKLLGDKLAFTWKKSPGAGSYRLKAFMTAADGQTGEKVLEVQVR